MGLGVVMVEYVTFGGLVVCVGLGVALAAFQLPGTWLILATAVAYDWYYGWAPFGWRWLAILGVAAVAAEFLDLSAGLIAARRAGASRRAAVGALIGGFVGMIALSVPIPIPGVGAIIGGLIGCFLGALIAELSLRKELSAGLRIGLFATIGKVIGITAKTTVAMVIGGAVVSLSGWFVLGS